MNERDSLTYESVLADLPKYTHEALARFIVTLNDEKHLHKGNAFAFEELCKLKNAKVTELEGKVSRLSADLQTVYEQKAELEQQIGGGE